MVGGRGPAGVADRPIDKTAVRVVFAYRRIRASGREQPVDDAIVLENFEAARLDALDARAAERRLCQSNQGETCRIHISARCYAGCMRR
jgi:hypothetical protein